MSSASGSDASGSSDGTAARSVRVSAGAEVAAWGADAGTAEFSGRVAEEHPRMQDAAAAAHMWRNNFVIGKIRSRGVLFSP
jgi:hypothetical protein